MERVESAQAQAASGDGNCQTSNDSKVKHILRIMCDFTILLVVVLLILAFWLWLEPVKRGFFCLDQALWYSFRDSTIQTWMLILIGVIPAILILVTEIVQAKSHKITANIKLQLIDADLPSWAIKVYWHIGIFVFGMLVCELATDIAKHSIGRYRPDFIDVCQPTFANGLNCSRAAGWKYVENFTCGTNISNEMLKKLRLSFPSSHASFSAYTMAYSVIYLQIRMTWSGSKLFKHFLQFVLLMVAVFISLIQISDNKHHWSDVFAGIFLGVTVALLVANFIAGLGRPKSKNTC